VFENKEMSIPSLLALLQENVSLYSQTIELDHDKSSDIGCGAMLEFSCPLLEFC
jgi:hypothetical protein